MKSFIRSIKVYTGIVCTLYLIAGLSLLDFNPLHYEALTTISGRFILTSATVLFFLIGNSNYRLSTTYYPYTQGSEGLTENNIIEINSVSKLHDYIRLERHRDNTFTISFYDDDHDTGPH